LDERRAAHQHGLGTDVDEARHTRTLRRGHHVVRTDDVDVHEVFHAPPIFDFGGRVHGESTTFHGLRHGIDSIQIRGHRFGTELCDRLGRLLGARGSPPPEASVA
jgi:hypothetical protein